MDSAFALGGGVIPKQIRDRHFQGRGQGVRLREQELPLTSHGLPVGRLLPGVSSLGHSFRYGGLREAKFLPPVVYSLPDHHVTLVSHSDMVAECRRVVHDSDMPYWLHDRVQVAGLREAGS